MTLSKGTLGVPNNFDRGAAFYPLVVHYLMSLHGLFELLSRHMALHIDDLASRGVKLTPLDPYTRGDEVVDWYREDPSHRTVTKLFAKPSLQDHIDPDRIEIDPDDLAKEVFEHGLYLVPWMTRTAGILLILAWETTKDHSDGSPIWEFLRHCRHAAAHGSKFNLVGKEPTRPAEWGGLRMDPSLRGSPLFEQGDGTGLLMFGDPIRLLWDLEQAYPGLPPDLTFPT